MKEEKGFAFEKILIQSENYKYTHTQIAKRINDLIIFDKNLAKRFLHQEIFIEFDASIISHTSDFNQSKPNFHTDF